MSRITLSPRQAPADDTGLRLDLRRIHPAACAGLDAAGVAALPVWQGRQAAALGDFFDVSLADDGATEPTLVVAGGAARCDRLGWCMDGGTLLVHGEAGDFFAAGLLSGRVTLHGSAGLQAAMGLRGGSLVVHGNLGDYAAGALPGAMDGVRGGVIVVHGSVGARFGDRMRRGVAIVGGDAGDFFASRLVAGTLALGGQAGAHPGYGQRRGSLLFAGPAPTPPATFVPTRHTADVAWQLIARDVARLARAHGLDAGSPIHALPQLQPSRWAGDTAADGRGEWWLAGA